MKTKDIFHNKTNCKITYNTSEKVKVVRKSWGEVYNLDIHPLNEVKNEYHINHDSNEKRGKKALKSMQRGKVPG